MRLPLLLAITIASTALAQEHPKDTMCVKQKDGTYLCLASGKIEKEPCCDLGVDDPKLTPAPKPKKKAARKSSN